MIIGSNPIRFTVILLLETINSAYIIIIIIIIIFWGRICYLVHVFLSFSHVTDAKLVIVDV
jgi:hypothetical protein